MTRRSTLFAALAFVFLTSDAAMAQSPRAYRVEDLGSLGGRYLAATAMNAAGDIVGSAETADGSLHAFRWTRAGGLEDLGTFGGVESQATGINDRGDIVGFYFEAGFLVTHAFFLPAGGTVQAQSSDIFQTTGLANGGWFTGAAGNAPFRARPDGAVEVLSDRAGIGWNINANGDTVGASFRDNSPTTPLTAFRYSDAGGFVDLGTFGGASSVAWGINASGIVVGGADTAAGRPHAFRAAPGGALQDLIPPSEPDFVGSVAYGINDAGDIVGATDGMVFRYTDAEGLIDLTPRIPLADRARGQLYSAIAINAAQQILAIYTDSDGVFHTELLTPREHLDPPRILELSAEPNVLRPPNGHMVPVGVSVLAGDEYDADPSCRIAAVIDSDNPFGSSRNVEITGPLTVNLRAGGQGHGRTYAVIVRCSTYLGGAVSGVTFVRAPAHR